MKTGCDISHHQSNFNAAAYKTSGQDFIILKATEGGSFIDSTFTDRWRAAGAVGLARGAYAFARPGGTPVDVQADHFLTTVRAAGWRAGDVWALDLEDAGGRDPQSLLTWADRWCERVRAVLGGHGLFYSYPHFIRDQLGNPGRIPGGCLGWWARYAADPYAGLFRPGGWPDPPSCWQCSNGEIGCVTDVASVGRCDFNRMTDTAFAELFGGQEPPQEDDMFEQKDRDQLVAIHAALTVPGTTSPEETVNLLFARVRTVEAAVRPTADALAALRVILEAGPTPVPVTVDAAAVVAELVGSRAFLDAVATTVADELARRGAE